MEKLEAAVEADGEIGVAVVIVIARGATDRVRFDDEAGGSGDIFEAAIAEIAIERGSAAAIGIGEEQIRLAIAVVIEYAGARAEKFRACFWNGRGRRRMRRQSRFFRYHFEVNGNFRQERGESGRGLFGERIFSLFAINQADGRAEFILRQVLEAGQVRFGFVGLAGTLVGLREAEFRRDVKGIGGESALIFGNCFFVLMELRKEQAEKIVRFRIGGIDGRYVFKRSDGFFGFVGGFLKEAEIEPGSRALRIGLRGFEQDFSSNFVALQVEKRDALIQTGREKLRIERGGLFEIFQTFFHLLLVERGDSEAIQTRGLLRFRGSGGRGG